MVGLVVVELSAWLVVRLTVGGRGEAGCEAVSLIVVELSAWMVGWCCGCLVGFLVVGLGKLVRGQAVCSVGWLVVELAAVMVVWGSACLFEGVSVACIVGWWIGCLLR